MDKEKLTVNNMRVLANEMITKAGSGHPGIVLSAMPILYTLYAKHVRISPKESKHILRDRVVLSAGHGSAMLYTVLYAMGFPVKKEDIINFRKLGSVTSGHPELEFPGVDVATGPLGQGVANAVGMAIASKRAQSLYNTEKCQLFDNKIYCILGDGCLMEGVAYESLCLAGTLQLDNLIFLYDCNKITIDGRISETFDINTKKMMEALGFAVLEVKDGNDLQEIDQVICKAKTMGKPCFIICNTLIGYGSLYQDNPKIHGNPLKQDELQELKNKFGISCSSFEWMPEVKVHLEKIKQENMVRWQPLKDKLNAYKKIEKEKFAKLSGEFENKFDNLRYILDAIPEDETMSSRDMSGKILNVLGQTYPNIICGSADLKGSTKCQIAGQKAINYQDFSGQNIMFGIREHAMSAIANGVTLFGGVKMFVSTFLSFCDYMKGGMRMSSFMNLPVTYVLTHDSILVGEDGPTHQPVEQINSLRTIPNMSVWRPCNMAEAKACYYSTLTNLKPTCFIGSRQYLKKVDGNFDDALHGAYIVSGEGRGNLEGIILATGSEVALAIEAQILLLKNGFNVRVVSVPSIDTFLSQPESYRKKILPPRIKSILAIEAGDTSIWYQLVGLTGDVLGMNTFGKSGKAEDVYADFGFTIETIFKKMKKLIKQNHSKIYTLLD